MNLQASPIDAAADGIPLLEVLPVRADACASGWQRQTFVLDATPADALVTFLQRNGQAPAAMLAALALVESRLTGADRVLVTRIATSGLEQAVVAIDDRCACGDWQASLLDALQPSLANASPAAWAVVDDAADLDSTVSITSTWRVSVANQLRADDPAIDGVRIDVAFRAPLTAESVGLIAGCVWRALAALASNVTIAGIDVIDPDERQRQLVEWNDTARSRAAGDTVHGRFAAVRDARARGGRRHRCVRRR